MPGPKLPIEWFQRASEQLDLRTPGAKPFHMRVAFHAYPGMELLDIKKRPEIVAGDGIYEETWMDTRTWRREVTLDNYHAVEVDGDGARKMQASSDYEPSRVLMLLNSILNPIPRDLSSREYMEDGVSGWKIEYLKNQTTSLVRIGKADHNPHVSISEDFYFLPQGLLVFHNQRGLITKWENDIAFAGKIVAKHLIISAGEQPLVSADVMIEAASQVDPKLFDLPTDSADSNWTLRPLHPYEVRMSGGTFTRSMSTVGPPQSTSGYVLWFVLDRQGWRREIEVIDTVNPTQAKYTMDQMRKERSSPATIDHKPCEISMNWDMY